MKKLLLSLLISFFGFQGIAQDPDPDLFRTWYLYFVQDTDMGTPYEVSEIDPPIDPYIIISENLDFYGEGACNSFNGTFSFANPNEMTAINFSNTTDDCGFQIHNSFENSYFGFMHYFWYEITQDENGLTLNLGHPLMGSAIFKDYPLSTSDFYLNEITVYPNPVKDILKIHNTNLLEITSIKIYDVLGRLVLVEKGNLNQVDVSYLDRGVLFVDIETDQGVYTKKVIKE